MHSSLVSCSADIQGIYDPPSALSNGAFTRLSSSSAPIRPPDQTPTPGSGPPTPFASLTPVPNPPSVSHTASVPAQTQSEAPDNTVPAIVRPQTAVDGMPSDSSIPPESSSAPEQPASSANIVHPEVPSSDAEPVNSAVPLPNPSNDAPESPQETQGQPNTDKSGHNNVQQIEPNPLPTPTHSAESANQSSVGSEGNNNNPQSSASVQTNAVPAEEGTSPATNIPNNQPVANPWPVVTAAQPASMPSADPLSQAFASWGSQAVADLDPGSASTDATTTDVRTQGQATAGNGAAWPSATGEVQSLTVQNIPVASAAAGGSQPAIQGNPGSIQGSSGSVQGNPGSVQGNPGSRQGSPGSVQGNPGSRQGSPGSIQGNPDSLEGNLGSMQGNPGSLQGNRGSSIDNTEPSSSDLPAADNPIAGSTGQPDADTVPTEMFNGPEDNSQGSGSDKLQPAPHALFDAQQNANSAESLSPSAHPIVGGLPNQDEESDVDGSSFGDLSSTFVSAFPSQTLAAVFGGSTLRIPIPAAPTQLATDQRPSSPSEYTVSAGGPPLAIGSHTVSIASDGSLNLDGSLLNPTASAQVLPTQIEPSDVVNNLQGVAIDGTLSTVAGHTVSRAANGDYVLDGTSTYNSASALGTILAQQTQGSMAENDLRNSVEALPPSGTFESLGGHSISREGNGQYVVDGTMSLSDAGAVATRLNAEAQVSSFSNAIFSAVTAIPTDNPTSTMGGHIIDRNPQGQYIIDGTSQYTGASAAASALEQQAKKTAIANLASQIGPEPTTTRIGNTIISRADNGYFVVNNASTYSDGEALATALASNVDDVAFASLMTNLSSIPSQATEATSTSAEPGSNGSSSETRMVASATATSSAVLAAQTGRGPTQAVKPTSSSTYKIVTLPLVTIPSLLYITFLWFA